MSRYQYNKIAEDLRSKIQTRELEHGARLPTERELARQWKVTPVTVSRAMRQLVDDGLIVRLRGRHGSFVSTDQKAKTESTNSAFRRIGVVYSWYISSGYYSNALLQGIEEAIRPEDKIFALSYSGFHNYSQLVEQEYLDGLILLSPPEYKHAEVQALRERQTPFVIIGSSWESEPDWPAIDSDGRQMGRLAAEHLLDCGYERIAAVVCSTQLSNNRLRLDAFLNSMALAGVHIPPEWLLIEPQQTDYECEIRKMLSAENRPQAVFAGNFLVAETVAGVADRLGLRIPTDLAIMGCDSANDGRVLNRLPLTTVTQPLREMGRRGMAAFLRQLSGAEEEIEPSLLPVTLVRGVTTLANSASRRNALAGTPVPARMA